jgi:hypothetical protein
MNTHIKIKRLHWKNVKVSLTRFMQHAFGDKINLPSVQSRRKAVQDLIFMVRFRMTFGKSSVCIESFNRKLGAWGFNVLTSDFKIETACKKSGDFDGLSHQT